MSYAGIFTDKNNTDHPVTSALYGTCDTAAATAAKVVTCADVDALTSGMTIRVKFTNANTAESPTINVNSTGAKTVYRFGTTAPVDGDSWKAGEVVELLYDGTYFYMVSADDIGSKQDTLTFDSAPTSASTNPVTSGGVYAALADKADNDIIAAEFDSTANYVVGNYCIYQGGLYKFKANHTGAWAAADVDAITIAGELTAKQPKTDNNLTTTSKDTTGAINELKSGLTNHFVNLITANAIIVANTAKAGTTIAKAQLRHDNRFAELVINITNADSFDTGDTGVMLNIDWSKTGVSFNEFKSACGTCNTNASYPDFAHAGAISAWTLYENGDVYMRLSESGIKAARLCFVFKLAW